MLGGGNQGCGGPVSWWWSEVWKCSPRVSPNCTASSTSTQEMADCDQCNGRFSILKRKRTCSGCSLIFCGSCVKRGMGGSRLCNKCQVLSQWPLDRSQVAALRVKDLRHFLHSRHINTITCTEKRDLIDLVTRHICSQHVGSGNASWRSTASNNESNTSSTRERPQYKSPTSTVTRDDGIRVRACDITPNHDLNSMGSIRVRPMDSIRVRPGRPLSPDSNDYDPETDLGIRVFASNSTPNPPHEQRASSTSPVSVEGCSESPEEMCSGCPSEDCTMSCCSLDSCHNGASSQPQTCPHKADHSSHCSLEDVSLSSEGRVPASFTSPDLPNRERLNSVAAQDDDDDSSQSIHNQRLLQRSSSESQQQSELGGGENSISSSSSSEVPTNTGAAAFRNQSPSAPPVEVEDPEPPAATSPSSASSSTFASGASSPEAAKVCGLGIVALESLKSEEDIRRLSIRQCKELLALHRVNLSGVREKYELVNKVNILWKDYQNTHQDVDSLPEEMICKICMDSVIDCVLLECGHMVSCTQCGKQMSECPVCRQYVVRVVRTFRA